VQRDRSQRREASVLVGSNAGSVNTEAALKV